MLGFILIYTIELKNDYTLKMLYGPFDRSNIEFGSLIRGQNSTDDLIDNVQYKFLKSIVFRLNLPMSRNSFFVVANTINIQPCTIRWKVFKYFIYI